MQMERSEWLQARKEGLGGSDSPVVLGESKYKTRSELWAEKRGLTPDLDQPTPAMQRGTILEPVAAELYAERTGRTLRRSFQILAHPGHPWMLANLDRHIVSDGEKGPGVLEIKCPGLQVFAQCKRQGLATSYVIQLQHYLAVKGWTWGSFAIFNAEKWEMVFFDIQADPDLQNVIISMGADFWNAVVTGEPVQDRLGTAVVVEALPPAEPSEIVTVDDPAWKIAIEKLREAREIAAEAEALETEAKEAVQEIMTAKGANVAEGAGARIYWKFSKARESFDSKRFFREHPEIDKVPYIKTGEQSRPFKPYFFGGVVNE